MITITENVRKKFLTVLETENRQGQGMRVTAVPGQSPLSVEYALAFVDPGQENKADQIIELEEFNVHIDPDSAPLLDGAVVDYLSGLDESGFKITNPKAAAGPPVPTGPMADKIQHIIDSKVNPD